MWPLTTLLSWRETRYLGILVDSIGTQTSYYDAFSELNRGGLYYWRVYADYSSLGGRYNEGGWRHFMSLRFRNFL
jgi:hypothetical protein